MNGLADHLSGTGAISLASSIRSDMQNYVLRELLPSAGSSNLAAWQTAVDPRLNEPSEMADAMRINWNLWVPRQLLPVLADSADPGTPRDGEHLAEAYTRHAQAQIRQAEGVSLRDYAAAGKVETTVTQLSRRSRELDLVNGWYEPRVFFLRHQKTTGLTLAAFAIMNGKPLPLDPVYGLPYKWDPAKHELALPDTPDRPKYKLKPIEVPKM
ncbi:MAG: hypothetical protein EOP87_23200 [Verrucomicrobiaceae bacterium]|nr:MAG: hypothetical protein EOP87_23200 [Verrucomicrobiaceae bacterium]